MPQIHIAQYNEWGEHHRPLIIDLCIDRLYGCQRQEIRLSATEHHILVDGFFSRPAKNGYYLCSDNNLLCIIGYDDDDEFRSMQPVRRAIHGLRKKLKNACGHCCRIEYVAARSGYYLTDYEDCTIMLPLKEEDQDGNSW